MRFSNRHASGDELLPKMLFYSVLIHYAFVYLFFGNPFLMLNRDDGPPGSSQSFDIQLLNFPMNGGGASQALLATVPPNKEGFDQVSKPTVPTTRIQDRNQEEGLDEDLAETEIDQALNSETVGEAEDQMAVPSKALKPSLLATAKKVVREMPPNMTGPEDCMLKLVGMVCPQGKIGCIRAYRAFCASLPK